MKTDAFGARSSLDTGFGRAAIYRLDALEKAGVAPGLARLPFSIKVLLEAVLRNVDGELVTAEDVKNLGAWNAASPEGRRAAVHARARDPAGLHRRPRGRRPRLDARGGEAPRRATRSGSTRSCPWTSWSTTRCRWTSSARRTRSQKNAEIEFERNRERYEFLRWGQKAFAELPRGAARDRHRPPGEPRVPGQGRARCKSEGGETVAMPDTLVGTDSHTTMINGLGVLGWGVGGIEAEAAMLGQPLYMVTPQVVGFRLVGQAARGRDRDRPRADRDADAAQEGRRREVRGVLRPRARRDEPRRPRDDRQHGARVRRHLRLLPGRRRDARATCASTGRSPAEVDLVERYARSRASSARRRRPTPSSPTRSSSTSRRSSRASPARSGRRTAWRSRAMKASFRKALTAPGEGARLRPRRGGRRRGRCRSSCAAARPTLGHGAVVIAAITSCTNTSNPSVMLGAGLLARRPCARGLRVPPHVKTSLAPGSKVVTEYLRKSGLLPRPRGARLPRRRLRLHDLHRQQRPAAGGGVEGRQRRQARGRGRALRQPQLRGPREPRREGQLPRLAAARGGLRARRHDRHRPRDASRSARPSTARRCMLADIWPTQKEVAEARGRRSGRRCSRRATATCSTATPTWNAIPVTGGDLFDFREDSTYIQEPPFFQGLTKRARAAHRHRGRARPRRARRLGDDRPHLARRRHRARVARPGASWARRASRRRTSTPTARAAATTG